MIIIVVEEQHLNKIELALLSTVEEIEKLPYIHLIVDKIGTYKAEYDLLDFLWGNPSGNVIVLYGTTCLRFKEDYRITKNNYIIAQKDFWPEAQRIYESINGPIQP